MSTSDWLDDLNPEQRRAVTFGDGPLLVIAGAGTGKTRTLACRVAHLIERGVNPDRILLLTFTRRAAAEMIRRASDLVDPSSAARVWGGTFHAVANRLLRHYGRALDLPPDFTVMDPADAAELMNMIRDDLGLASGDRRFPRKETLVSIYSRMVNARTGLADTLKTAFPWCEDYAEDLSRIFNAYQDRKREQIVLDYDDLLIFWNALTRDDVVADPLGDRFDHVLVDEYQDTNLLQAEILQGMRRRNPNVMVVGDDAQSIYAFRAATIRNILDFPKQFPGAAIVTLERNYRSVQPILDVSNAVMEQAKERYTKELRSTRAAEHRPALVYCDDESEQSEAVLRRILAHLEEGVPLRHQAVLFRAGHHSAELEVLLARRKIPFHKYGGLRFIETAHIRDLLAMLRVLENPFDVLAWLRVLMLMPGIGVRSARRVMDELGATRPAPRSAMDPREAFEGSPLVRFFGERVRVPSAAEPAFDQLRRTLEMCCGKRPFEAPAKKRPRLRKPSPDVETAAANSPPDPQPLPVASQVELLRRFYEPLCERNYENAAVRLRDIEQLQHIASGYAARQAFIADLTLDPPTSASDLASDPSLEEDYLILSTIHSAKGCEWQVVHVLHVADGMIPSDLSTGDTESLDEERRLLYVALTRAKDFLYLYFPLRYHFTKYRFGQAHSFAKLSRFLTKDVRRRLAEVAAARPGAGASPGPRRDPRADLRKLWT